MKERRMEPRIDVDAPAVMTPLASVSTRLTGQVINVSEHGVRIRMAEEMSAPPRIGDVYRILSSQDRMLCEVSHCMPGSDGIEIGFRILHWGETGELKRVTKANWQTTARTEYRGSESY